MHIAQLTTITLLNGTVPTAAATAYIGLAVQHHPETTAAWGLLLQMLCLLKGQPDMRDWVQQWGRWYEGCTPSSFKWLARSTASALNKSWCTHPAAPQLFVLGHLLPGDQWDT